MAGAGCRGHPAGPLGRLAAAVAGALLLGASAPCPRLWLAPASTQSSGSPRATRSAATGGRSRSCRGRAAGAQVPRQAEAPAVSWIDVADGPDEEPAGGASVMPVFPLNVVEWPSGEVGLNIIEPAYRKMYDDILLSGTRRFLMPFSPCVPGFPRGRVRFPEMPPEDRRLHAVAPILYLEDLRELSEQTNDRVKYQVRHTVVGRARMTRLLNPSALFRTNSDGWKVNYLRAEARGGGSPCLLGSSAFETCEEIEYIVLLGPGIEAAPDTVWISQKLSQH